MSSFWMPNKKPLYAPMLASFGGGSSRGFSGNSISSTGGGLFTIHGDVGSIPYWSQNSTYSIPEISGHYGMGRDTFARYLIINSRYGGDAPQIWIPIAPDGEPLVADRFFFQYPPSVNQNNFGAFADTIRGRIMHQKYSTSESTIFNLPANFTGLSEENPAGSYIPGATYSLTGPNGSVPDMINNNDAGFHLYKRPGDGPGSAKIDAYYIVAGRNGLDYRWINIAENRWYFGYSLGGGGASGIYGIDFDYSTQARVVADRSANYFVYTDSGNYQYFGDSGVDSCEDLVIGYTGDLYTFKGNANNSEQSLVWHKRAI